jgi:hypothetical protein
MYQVGAWLDHLGWKFPRLGIVLRSFIYKWYAPTFDYLYVSSHFCTSPSSDQVAWVKTESSCGITPLTVPGLLHLPHLVLRCDQWELCSVDSKTDGGNFPKSIGNSIHGCPIDAACVMASAYEACWRIVGSPLLAQPAAVSPAPNLFHICFCSKICIILWSSLKPSLTSTLNSLSLLVEGWY